MATFAYKALNQTGNVVTGTLEATSREELVQALGRKKVTILAVQEQKSKAEPNKSSSSVSIKKKAVLIFTRQLQALLKAGLSLVEAIGLLTEQTDDEQFKKVLNTIAQDLNEGNSFSFALKKYPKVFSDLYCNSVEVGELSGTLDKIMATLTIHMEADLALQKKLTKAFRYPFFVILALIMAFVVFVTVVIPRFAPFFERSQTELPLPTKIMLALNDLFMTHGILIAGITASVIVSLFFYYRSPAGKKVFHAYLLHVPVFGSLLKQVANQRFATTLALLGKHGVAMVPAMKTAARTESNWVMRHEMQKVQQQVEQGENIATAMKRSRVFPKILMHMVAVGEMTGSLETMLENVATFLSEEIEQTIEAITAMIEPVVTTVLAVFVLILALSIFLPMWNMLHVV